MKPKDQVQAPQEHEAIDDLIRKAGIPVSSCYLYQAVDGEQEFSETSSHPMRKAEMFYTPIGLVAFKQNRLSKRMETIIIPLPTVAYARIKQPKKSSENTE